LHDLGGLGEPMKVLKDKDRRALWGGQGGHGSDRSQRIRTTRVRFVLTGDAEASVNVPRRQPPILFTAEGSDFGESILVFMRLDPDGSETSTHVFHEAIFQVQNGFPFKKWFWNLCGR